MAPVLAPEWTDLHDHDPGVTTLQAFAWLCDSLNYYINATGEAHRLAYLKLLGIRPAAPPRAAAWNSARRPGPRSPCPPGPGFWRETRSLSWSGRSRAAPTG